MSELSQNNCNGNLTDSFKKDDTQHPICNLYRLSQDHFTFPSWAFQSISPTALTLDLSENSPWGFLFINSHLHSCSATQWIHYFLSPLTACSSFWLFFIFPTTHTFYNKGKPTKCLTNKILPLLFYPNRACFSRCIILVLWYFLKDGN